MKTTLLTLAVAAALVAVAGCDRAPEQRANQTPPTSSAAGGATSAPATPQANTPSTPANAGAPSAAEKRDGSNPTQGQVDPKQKPQQKDFQHQGDGAGPKPGGG